MPDSEKLRRFSLLMALLFFSYSVAGIHIEQGEKILLLGIPFTVSNPELVPLGLVVASVYGLVRFYYYEVMLHATPYRTRQDLLKILHGEGGRGTYKGSVYFGPTKFSTTPGVLDPAGLEDQVGRFIAAFPMIGRRRPEGKVVSHDYTDENGDPCKSWRVEYSIPVRCRLAAFFQDIDYTAPIWANVSALAVTMARTVT